MVSLLQPSLLWAVLLLIVPRSAQSAESTYCVAGSPSVSWPSNSILNNRNIALAETGARLSLTKFGSSIAVQLTTATPWHRASMRIDRPGTFSRSSGWTTVLDCGPQAVGVANSNSAVLLGFFSPQEEPLELPLRFDITIVQSQGQDGSVIYAFEKIFLEEWMLDAPRQTGKSGDVDVIATGNGGLDVSSLDVIMEFAEPEIVEPIAQWIPLWTKAPLPAPPLNTVSQSGVTGKAPFQWSSAATASTWQRSPAEETPVEPANTDTDSSSGWGTAWTFIKGGTTSETNAYALASSGPSTLGGASMGLLCVLWVMPSLL